MPSYQRASKPGIPMQIVSPEFDFQIESIDPTFKSEAAKLVGEIAPRKVFEDAPDTEQEAKRALWKVGLVGIIVIMLGYLGFSLWKRKK